MFVYGPYNTVTDSEQQLLVVLVQWRVGRVMYLTIAYRRVKNTWQRLMAASRDSNQHPKLRATSAAGRRDSTSIIISPYISLQADNS